MLLMSPAYQRDNDKRNVCCVQGVFEVIVDLLV